MHFKGFGTGNEVPVGLALRSLESGGQFSTEVNCGSLAIGLFCNSNYLLVLTFFIVTWI